MTIRLIWIILICYSPLYSSSECLNADGFRLHAEFEKQNAIWIAWSSDAGKIGYPYSSVQTEIIQQLAPHINVKVVVKDDEELSHAKLSIGLLAADKYEVSYFVIPNDAIWLRDIGPYFLKNSSQELEVASFDFNNWGHQQFEDPDASNLENNRLNKVFGLAIANMMEIRSLCSGIISEGGNRDHNGQGTMIVVDAVENQRIPYLTKDQIFEEYHKILGIRKIIRLKQGMCQDEVIERGPIPGPTGIRNAFTLLGNSGHVDAFCRFAGPNTILLAEVDPQDAERDPIAYENRLRLEENYNILKNATDADGNPFNIVRMPATDSLYVTLNPEDPFYEYLLELNFPVSETFPEGKFPHVNEVPFLLPTSYLNFIIANDVILIPKFWHEGLPESTKAKDEKAAGILQSLFPEKHMIAIDVLNVNICGGGIHCLTQHEP